MSDAQKRSAFLVPIVVDHLVVDTRLSRIKHGFAGKLVDFSLLPHALRERHHLPRRAPNVSEDLVAKPFEATNDPLEIGVHLHWTLPRELRRGIVADPATAEGAKPTPRYAPIPDRWLIERRIFEDDDERTPATFGGPKIRPQRWLLESDALIQRRRHGSGAYPHRHRYGVASGGPNYRYLGRVVDLSRVEEEPPDEPIYLDGLSAFGYGEPLFGAYYPECRNVLGFHDDLAFAVEDEAEDAARRTLAEALVQGTKRLEYLVTGWYADPRRDPLTSARLTLTRDPAAAFRIDAEPKLDEDRYGPSYTWYIAREGDDVRAWSGHVERLADSRLAERVLGGDAGAFADGAHGDLFRGRAIFHGSPRDVKWSAAPDAATPPRDGVTRVALGNSAGQAFAALLGAAAEPEAQYGTETMIEALQLGLYDAREQLDFPQRIDTGRHEAGFVASRGEHRWVIRLEDKPDADMIRAANARRPPVDEIAIEASAWSAPLAALNEAQTKIDDLGFELRDRRTQLYADWYKYLLMEYDLTLDEITAEGHVNALRSFIAERSAEIFELEASIAAARGDVERRSAALQASMDNINRERDRSPQVFRLLRVPGERFWSPREPVILIEGDDAKVAPKYRRSDVPLAVRWEPELLADDELGPEAVREALKTDDDDAWSKLRAHSRAPFEGHDEAQDWYPLFMDWEVDLYPFTKPAGADFNQRDWPTDAIVQHYDLFDGECDLRLQSVRTLEGDPTDLYKKWLRDNPEIRIQAGKRIQSVEGRSILTPDAHLPLVENLKRLMGSVAEDDARWDLVRRVEAMPLLAQTLSGFNDAMLMRKQILQLAVEDPLARTEILASFARELQSAIGSGNDVAPLPSNLFLPIREGAFRLKRLRLVDMWGRTRDLRLTGEPAEDTRPSNVARLVVADALRPPPALEDELRPLAYLPPRIVQPARVSCRFRAGEGGSSVSGFVLPNFADRSLHVFDSNGVGLGVIARSRDALVWRRYPGRAHRMPVDAIVDACTRRFVRSMLKLTPRFLGDFLQTARRALGATLVDDFAQFDGVALLVGRPLALVRASVALRVQGEPAVNNAWDAREAEYGSAPRHATATMGFDRLRFAVRLGAKDAARDGLFAFYDDVADADVRELYSPYAEGVGRDAETYWHELGMAERARTTLAERVAKRGAQATALDSELRVLEARLESALSGGISSPKADARIAELQAAVDDRTTARGALAYELDQLERNWENANGVIEDVKLRFGAAHEEPGIYAPHCDHVAVALADAPYELVLLMDPRSAVTLTTGILPVKQVALPTEDFAEALKNIALAFTAMPVISPMIREASDDDPEGQRFFLVSPEQAGQRWSWLQAVTRETWEETPPSAILQPPPFDDTFGPQAIHEGWLKLSVDEGGEGG